MLQVYLMEPTEEVKHASVKIRRERFFEGLLRKEDVLKIVREELLKDDILEQEGFIRIGRLLEEMDVLVEKSIHFGQYKDNASLEALDMDKAVVELKQYAPVLSATLDKLLEDRRDPQRRSAAAVKNIQYRSAVITSICCNSRGRKASNYLQNIIGLYLQSSGVKRRVISTIQGCGLSVSQPTILKATGTLNAAAKERQQHFDLASVE